MYELAPTKKKRFFKGATRRCCYGICKSDTRSKSFQECTYYFIGFPKPCLPYRKGLIAPEKKNHHIKNCANCAKCALWVQACRRADGRFDDIDHVKKETYICSLHFKGRSGPSEAYPNPVDDDEAENMSEKVIIPRNTFTDHYTNLNVENGNIITTSETLSNIKIDDSEWNYEYLDSNNDEENQEEIAGEFEPYSYDDEFTEENDCTENYTETEDRTFGFVTVCSVGTQYPEECITQSTSTQCDTVRKCNRRTQTQLNHNPGMIEFVRTLRKDDKKCLFYTGFRFSNLVALHSFLSPECEKLCGSFKQGENEIKEESHKNKGKLTSMQQLILLLVRLRVGLLVEDLSFRFNISTGLISKIITNWIQFMHDHFKTYLIPLLLQEDNLQNCLLPSDPTRKVRAYFDCAEFSCQSPLNFPSNKAHPTSFKVLIACTPNGRACFVSDMYDIKMSNQDIIIQSNIADSLRWDDNVTSDKNFNVHEIVKSRQAPFLLENTESCSQQKEIPFKKKRTVKQRMGIKQIICKVKQFRLLQKTIPSNMRDIMSQMVFVCASLLNFQEPIVDQNC